MIVSTRRMASKRSLACCLSGFCFVSNPEVPTPDVGSFCPGDREFDASMNILSSRFNVKFFQHYRAFTPAELVKSADSPRFIADDTGNGPGLQLRYSKLVRSDQPELQ
jgi:hypothetical protein